MLSGPALAVENVAGLSQSFKPIQIEITTSCLTGEARFKVRNVGAAWPDVVSLEIYHQKAAGGQLITKRKLELKPGQQVSFRINKNQAKQGLLGMWVAPAWYEREFTYDASADCRG